MYTRDAPHDFVYIHLTVVMVFGQTCLIKHFFNVLHGIGSRVCRQWTRLSDGVDVAHVTDGWGNYLVLISNGVVELFVGRVGLWDEVVLVLIGVVGSG